MRTLLRLKAALLLFPVFLGTPRSLHAQERPPFTLEQIEALLAARLAPSVIVEMAGADCLAFRLNEETEGRLRAAGATDELITGLRNVCYKGAEPEQETPTETPSEVAPSSISLPYSPGSAALRSLAIPGLGQFYTRRPAVGAIFLAGWAGALSFGFIRQDVTVECLARVGESEPCPPDQVRGRVTERPMLVVGLGTAVAVAVISAIEARSGANKANARQIVLGQGAGGSNLFLEILPPPASAAGQRLVLLQLRHR